MLTKTLVERLCERHKTRDAFQLADALGIVVLFEPLGQIKGYYNCYCRQKFIHINEDLERREQAFTCSHELGHALLHPKINTPFLRKSTLFSVSKLEVEANRFAVLLMHSDHDLQPFLSRSISAAAAYMQIPISLAEYRMTRVEPMFEECFYD